MSRPALLLLVTCVAAGPLPYTGVNLSGAEFGPKRPGQPRVFGHDYTYPTAGEVDYFTARGATVIRLPFLWAQMQPKLNGPLDPPELARLTKVVRLTTAKGCVALLDPHDYARRDGHVIGDAAVPAAAFADLWRRLATEFAADDHVWFGLMNEPHDMPANVWVASANAAIAAIRRAGAKNLILVPGVAWTGAHSWAASGNAVAMLKVADPADHYAIEVHQYLDHDSSGGKDDVGGPTVGSKRIAAFTAWCRANHRRAFLGEFAAADSAVGRAAIDDLLTTMEAAPDVWLGWTWWAAGPWWGDYMFTLEPKRDGTDRPQMAWLKPHLHGSTPGAK